MKSFRPFAFFNNIGLILKFDIVFIAVFSVAMLAAAMIFRPMFDRNARLEVTRHAGLIMENAMAIRKYTTQDIKPVLPSERNGKFVPETVPAFSATKSFSYLREKYPEYFYKEATLNPTNMRDLATQWESSIIQQFRKDPKLTEVAGIRSTKDGDVFYLSRPIRIKDPNCLQCHSVPAAAPASMIRDYGSKNGFGWKLDEVIGAQVLVVPTSLPESIAEQTFRALMATLTLVLIAMLVVLNIMMRVIVVQPILKLSQVADDVSKGNLDVADLPVKGQDEIGVLSGSFNRMQRSLRQAIKMLEE